MSEQFPTLPTDTSTVLIPQPILGSNGVARAFAASLLYRFFRILTPCDDAESCAEARVQTVLAEWLQVYAGLLAADAGAGSFLRWKSSTDLQAHNRVQPILQAGAFPGKGAIVPPAVLLVLCAYWLAQRRQSKPDASSGLVIPSPRSQGEAVRAAAQRGAAMAAVVFCNALRVAVSADAGQDPHPCGFAVFIAGAPIKPTSTDDLAALLGDSWPGRHDAKLPAPPHVTLDKMFRRVPIDGALVGIVVETGGAQHVWAVLSQLCDAPLEPLFLHFVADALVPSSKIALTPAGLKDICARVRVQFPSASRDAVRNAAVASLKRAFGEDAYERGMAGAPVPKLDTVPSTMSAALRKPKTVRPGRWFTRGPAMLALYFTQDTFDGLLTSRQIVSDFFQELGTRRVHAKDVFVFNRKTTDAEAARVLPLAKLQQSTTERGAYELRVCEPGVALMDCPPAATEELTGPLLQCVVFSVADCVWAAHTSDPRPREIIYELWNRFHVHDAPSRAFADGAASVFFQQVVRGNLHGAHAWMRDALADMVFREADMDAIEELLAEWAQLVSDSLEIVVLDPETGRLFTGPAPDIGATVRVTGTFVNLVDDDEDDENAELVHEALKKPFQLPENALRTRPLVRGVLLTTTQLALLFAIGTRAEFVALSSCLDAVSTSDLNLPILASILDNDRAEIRKRIAKLDAELPEHMSLLSRASVITLRA